MRDKERIAEIVRNEFRQLLREDCPENFADLPIAELGIDSLDFFDKLMVLEDEHGIVVPGDELDNDVTINGIIASLGAG